MPKKMLDNVKGNCRCECDVIDDALIHPQKTKANHQLNYSRLKSILIRIISIVCVILGALSIVLQVATVMIDFVSMETGMHLITVDFVGFGIWGGALYLTAGALGVASTQKQTKALLVSTLVMSAISIAASAVAALSSGLATSFIPFCRPTGSSDSSICNARIRLEWFLITFHLLAFASNIALTVLVSLALYKCTCSLLYETNECHTGDAVTRAEESIDIFCFCKEIQARQMLENSRKIARRSN